MRTKYAILLTSLLLSTQVHANLLKNGGAELGDLSGWTVGGLSNPTVDDGGFDPGISPRTGAYMFRGGIGSYGTLTQKVLLTGMGLGRELTVTFWEQGLDQDTPSDDGYVTLTYFSLGGAVLGTQSTDEIDSHDGVWSPYRGIFAVPLDAISVDYTMHFKRNFGLDLDAFFDDNSLTLTTVPEPSTAWLMLAGLGLMGAFWRRRTR
ncbi:conserved hypothetical protein [Ricinus communis]|uniref:Ice-binding protein C-terminal domain-containing protein n=1 Tax=Ricinus communis TaxID=3988 RepID=B9TB39_RICCO|nr:conserved hypothetical protein [Ricinus communis]